VAGLGRGVPVDEVDAQEGGSSFWRARAGSAAASMSAPEIARRTKRGAVRCWEVRREREKAEAGFCMGGIVDLQGGGGVG
jgi:hypothetical protein